MQDIIREIKRNKGIIGYTVGDKIIIYSSFIVRQRKDKFLVYQCSNPLAIDKPINIANTIKEALELAYNYALDFSSKRREGTSIELLNLTSRAKPSQLETEASAQRQP